MRNKKDISLEDKYLRRSESVFISGVQSLVRLPLIQKERDQERNLNTAGFISGYQGSPLGSYDLELFRAGKYLKDHEIIHRPGINEELAATSVWGSQQIDYRNRGTKDGIYGIWYGKGPGLDRSMDAIKHANAAGTSKYGGVLAVVGDDHGAKSSTIPHQSDHDLISAFVPYLYPSGIDDIISYGLLGFEMSRYSGCWIGMKIVTEVADSAKTYEINNEKKAIYIPSQDDLNEYREINRNISFYDSPRDLDFKLQRSKGLAAQVFGFKNNIDEVKWPNLNSKIGLITSGKSYNDVREALRWLDIDKEKAKGMGICLFKIGMPWPLEPNGIRSFCEGLDQVLVIEEKRELIEHQIKWQLYNWKENVRPVVTGKYDENGNFQLPPENDLPLTTIVEVVAKHLYAATKDNELLERLEWFKKRASKEQLNDAPLDRKIFFCSGCPHNLSTKVPESSTGLAGIGCHYMVVNMDRNTELFTQMGGEGTPWIGQSPFSKDKHVFANLGDGTYKHSGSLAIRACVDANVNITFKILYNDAVAMTGGQSIGTNFHPVDIAKQVLAEGVNKVVILTERMEDYKKVSTPKVDIFHRDHLQNIQKELRETLGVTILIYDQGCAAQKRRKRKRGLLDDPQRKILINPDVCEGCGDCSFQSNCVSIEPLDTSLGRKRTINQSNCNKDFSCLKGFCPSFISVDKESVKTLSIDNWEFDIPSPVFKFEEDITNIILTGVGGTGVLTISAILGTAAHIENKKSTTMDMTGLAQKGGAVWAYIKIYDQQKKPYSHKISPGMSDLLLGCDQVVATRKEIQEIISQERTYAVLNNNTLPISDFVTQGDIDLKEIEIENFIRNSTKEITANFNASDISVSLFGSSINTNMIMLGASYQCGLVPLEAKSIHSAIALNESGAENNLRAFEIGRLFIHDPDNPIFLKIKKDKPIGITLKELENRLENYSRGYFEDYKDLKEKILNMGAGKNHEKILKEHLRVCLIKDEYEVARLHLENTENLINDNFSKWSNLKFYLAPPIFSFLKDKKTNRPMKIAIPAYIALPIFHLLRKFTFLRGTFWDPFHRTKDRKVDLEHKRILERKLNEYCEKKSLSNILNIIEKSKKVKGFGEVKRNNFLIFKSLYSDSVIQTNKLNS
ncbi:MAG TPA: indolepyruvate ferredoxin oxidoreductase family protein [SAR86 cluster bacterium]|jgi:indolepyruvate ferredoxin oxidoreductase|nr:indolepyruvate ferredoxin oxidoreductase family protein [SAR86 cluster bacterium]